MGVRGLIFLLKAPKDWGLGVRSFGSFLYLILYRNYSRYGKRGLTLDMTGLDPFLTDKNPSDRIGSANHQN